MSGFNLGELAQTLFEESGDALFLFDPADERMIEVNSMAQRLSGFTRAQLLSQPVSTLFRSERPEGLARLAQASRGSEPFHSQEGFWLRRSEEDTWVPVNLTVSRLRTGEGVRGLITARDISERRRAEQELRSSEARCRSVLQNLEQSVFLKDTNLRFIAANRRFCEAVGRPEKDILGKTDLDLYPSALAEKYRADDRRVLADGRRLEVEEENLLAGRMRRVRVIKTPVRDSQDQLVGVLGIFWDVTEQHALEEQLRQSQKMEAVGQLAGGVAHDFNNLLTAMLGNLSLLQGAIPPDSIHRPLLDATERAAWRAATLTRQLLGFSRRAMLHPEPMSVNQTVSEVVGLLQRTIDPRIRLRTRSADDLWLVQADPNQMSQVLMNLCLNARDAVQARLKGRRSGEAAESEPLSEAANILLETANVCLRPGDAPTQGAGRPGEFVRLSVRDNGTGIAPEAQTHIFEPFFTTKGPGKGTGLGLPMVFGIVQQHHGWIECHSVPGQGTRFDIYLPRHHVPAVPVATPAPHSLPLGGEETILLADDEPLIRNLGRSILESYGYRVLLAGDGQEAIEMYRRQPDDIDLLVLDLTMPRLSGRDALRRLREIDPTLRVVFASGYSAEHLSAEDQADIAGFVSKPYRPEELAQAVRTALDRPRPLLAVVPS